MKEAQTFIEKAAVKSNSKPTVSNKIASTEKNLSTCNAQQPKGGRGNAKQSEIASSKSTVSNFAKLLTLFIVIGTMVLGNTFNVWSADVNIATVMIGNPQFISSWNINTDCLKQAIGKAVGCNVESIMVCPDPEDSNYYILSFVAQCGDSNVLNGEIKLKKVNGELFVDENAYIIDIIKQRPTVAAVELINLLDCYQYELIEPKSATGKYYYLVGTTWELEAWVYMNGSFNSKSIKGWVNGVYGEMYMENGIRLIVDPPGWPPPNGKFPIIIRKMATELYDLDYIDYANNKIYNYSDEPLTATIYELVSGKNLSKNITINANSSYDISEILINKPNIYLLQLHKNEQLIKQTAFMNNLNQLLSTGGKQ